MSLKGQDTQPKDPRDRHWLYAALDSGDRRVVVERKVDQLKASVSVYDKESGRRLSRAEYATLREATDMARRIERGQ